MIEIGIPSRGKLYINHLACDYNGTLAIDGTLIENLIPLLKKLSRNIEIHVITADSFGKVREQMELLPVKLTIIPPDHQDQAKLDYVVKLGIRSVVALGNGYNDHLMVEQAALGISLIQEEGCSSQTLINSDIICRTAYDALNLLLHPKRFTATLRN